MSARRLIGALVVVALWACSRYPPPPRWDGPPREGSPSPDVVASFASGLTCTAIKDSWDFGFCEPGQG